MAAHDDSDDPVNEESASDFSTGAGQGSEDEPAHTDPVMGTTNPPGDRTEIAGSANALAQIPMPIKLDPPQREGSIGRMETYEILNVVGRGGMGVVARAFDEQLHRNVAIKVMSDRLIRSDRARKRFLREARAAASVNHPNVVTIHAVAESKGIPYLVMEYVDGQALQVRIQQDAPMPYEDVLRIGSQIASGLAAAHRHGIIHRDIKPGNVMLEDGIERVKLTDFGLARLLTEDSDLTSFGDMVGTPAYMSPEQVNGDELSASSDLFSLGCVLYAMFLGKSPFHAPVAFASANRVRDLDPEPLSSLVPSVPTEFSQLVARLLCKDPAGRPPSAAGVAETLLRWSAEIHQATLPSSRSSIEAVSGPANNSATGRYWLVAAVAIVMLVFGVSWFNRGTNDTALKPVKAEHALADGILQVHPSDGEYATLRAAIAAAQPDTTIQLLAGTYRGPFEITDDQRLRGLRIVGSEGVKLVGPAGAPVLRIANVSDCQVRELTIESGVLQIGLNVSGDCPGLSLRSLHLVARQPDQTKVELLRIDLGGSGRPEAPIEIAECDFDAGAVGLVIGSHDPSESPVKHVRVHHNRLRAASYSYGICLAVQGRVSDIAVTRNILRRAMGGLSLNLGVEDGADQVVFRNNTLVNIDVAFFLNDSIVDQDVRVQNNLVGNGRSLHTITGSPAQYDMWFADNHWIDGPEVERTLVSSMFTIVPSSVLRSLDPESPDFLKPTADAPKELAGFYGPVEKHVE